MFGQTPDPFALVPLVLLGLPWTVAMAMLVPLGFPDFLGQILIALAPLANIWLIVRSDRKR